MAYRTNVLSSLSAFALASLCSSFAFAQEPSAPPPTQAFPAPAPAQPAPQPAVQPAQPGYPAQTAPQAQPYPQPQPQPYPQQAQNYPPPPPSGNTEPGYGYSQPYAPPPPPPSAPDEGFKRPDISIRIDPLNMLFESRLGLELETQVWEFISFEVVPVFVISQRAPTLNYFSEFNSTLRQYSNGLGSMSGALFDVAFWFGGKPFRGYGLRVGLSDYGYRYETKDESGILIDHVKKHDSQFVVMLATVDRWGAFTLAGGIGVGYDLVKTDRCFNQNAPINLTDQSGRFKSTCSNPSYEIAVANGAAPPRIDLKSPLAPFDLMFRLSLGVTF